MIYLSTDTFSPKGDSSFRFIICSIIAGTIHNTSLGFTRKDRSILPRSHLQSSGIYIQDLWSRVLELQSALLPHRSINTRKVTSTTHMLLDHGQMTVRNLHSPNRDPIGLSKTSDMA